MSKEIEEFSSLFDLTPKIEILNLNSGCGNITTTLENLVNPFDGKITTLQTTNTNELKVKIKKATYNYGIICNTLLNSSNKTNLIKIISQGIRDSGYIIILENKDKNLEEIYNLLEEFDYGAVNSIDIFKDYDLIIGKKLHMWGMD